MLLLWAGLPPTSMKDVVHLNLVLSFVKQLMIVMNVVLLLILKLKNFAYPFLSQGSETSVLKPQLVHLIVWLLHFVWKANSSHL